MAKITFNMQCKCGYKESKQYTANHLNDAFLLPGIARSLFPNWHFTMVSPFHEQICPRCYGNLVDWTAPQSSTDNTQFMKRPTSTDVDSNT